MYGTGECRWKVSGNNTQKSDLAIVAAKGLSMGWETWIWLPIPDEGPFALQDKWSHEDPFNDEPDFGLEVYYCTGYENYIGTNANEFKTYVIFAMVDSYNKQVKEWTFRRPYDADQTYHVYINDGTNEFHGRDNNEALTGPDRIIGIRSNSFQDHNYSSVPARINAAVAHEFAHGIQYTYAPNYGRIWGDSGQWIREGQARFIPSVQYEAEEYNSPDHFFPVDANDYLQNYLNKSLKEMSYRYCLYWRFLFENHNPLLTDRGKIKVIENALTETAKCFEMGLDPIAGAQQAMDDAFDGRVGQFESFDESLESFAKANYMLKLDDSDPNQKYDHVSIYSDPRIEITKTFKGTDIDITNDIPVSFGMDFIEIQFSHPYNSATFFFDGGTGLYYTTNDDDDFSVTLLVIDDNKLIGEYPISLYSRSEEGTVTIAGVGNDPDDKVAIVVVRLDANEGSVNAKGDYKIKVKNTSVDVALAIDRSASMGTGYDYQNYIVPAKKAAATFVGLMDIGDNVAAISFNVNASVNFPLTLIESENTKYQAQNAISTISTDGRTSIGAGIQASQNELNKGRTEISQAMVLLSDGYENEPPFVKDILPTIPVNTDIYTIALGWRSDERLLQQIAHQTGGTYYFDPDANDLQRLYVHIKAKVTGVSVVTSYTGLISQGAVFEHTSSIDGSMDQTTFSVAFEGSDVDLELITPSGELINPAKAASDPRFIYTEGSIYDYYSIYAPEPGQWTLKIIGTDLPEPEKYTASVFGHSKLKMVTSLANDNYTVGDPIGIQAKITENDSAILNALVAVEVKAPEISFINRVNSLQKHLINDLVKDEGNSFLNKKLIKQDSLFSTFAETIYLYDDGTHGDSLANDGIYTNSYSNTMIDGSYVFTIKATGTTSAGGQFSREDILATFVAPFPSPTTITVTQPDGGEVWEVNTGDTIKWESDNYIGTVRIELSTNNGSNWWDITGGLNSDNTGAYFYTPCLEHISSHCLIRVISVENPDVSDLSDAAFSIIGHNVGQEYFVFKIPHNFSTPVVDGVIDEQLWQFASEDSLLSGGVPDQWGMPWTDWNDNLVTWQAIWSDVTNKLYVAVKVRDDVRGTFDNSDPNRSRFIPYDDDAIEFFTDGNNDGGYYQGSYDISQQWWLTGENKKILNYYPEPSQFYLYDGGDLIAAVMAGIDGNWRCEAEFSIYNNLPSDRKILAIGDTIGWNIWYDDSDDQTMENNRYVRDHQVGWIYEGKAYASADYFGDLILIDEIPVPHVKLTSPVGGESWMVGSNQTITWVADGTSGKFNLEISRDAGISWDTLFSNIKFSNFKNWTVTAPRSNQCLIKISDSQGNASDISDSLFAINSEPAWRVPIHISGGGQNLIRTFGGDLTATDGFDPSFDVTFPSAGMAYDAYFRITDYPDILATDVRSWIAPFQSAIDWTLEIVNANGITSTLQWDGNKLPSNGYFTLISPDFDLDLRTSGSVSVSGNNILTIQYRLAKGFTFDFPVQGWYLISLPKVPTDNRLISLFPTAAAAYAFHDDGKYYSETNLEPEQGYWLFVSSPDSSTIFGSPLTTYTKSYNAGWNLIGSVAGTTNFQDPNDNPDGSVVSTYGYDAVTGQYLQIYPGGTGILEEKQGYWLAVSQSCSLTIGGSSLSKNIVAMSAEKVERFAEQFGAQPPAPPFITDPAMTQFLISDKIESTNYPNPFNFETVIKYSLPAAGRTEIYIYNLLGQKIRTLLNAQQQKGFHQIVWSGRNDEGEFVANGVYFYRIVAAKHQQIKKILMLK
ncbi:VWA domain-containing protein [candidate division KSB1 bacterium]|nr:VWA domain-containing protein [candidate division KSB1 bacterium]